MKQQFSRALQPTLDSPALLEHGLIHHVHILAIVRRQHQWDRLW